MPSITASYPMSFWRCPRKARLLKGLSSQMSLFPEASFSVPIHRIRIRNSLEPRWLHLVFFHLHLTSRFFPNIHLAFFLLALSGLVALQWSANPSLLRQLDQTNSLIFSTSRYRYTWDCSNVTQRLGNSQRVPNNIYGYGIPDAIDAVFEP